MKKESIYFIDSLKMVFAQIPFAYFFNKSTMLCGGIFVMQLQSSPLLQFSQFSSKTTTDAFFPIGIHLPGCIGLFGENNPIAFFPKAEAI